MSEQNQQAPSKPFLYQDIVALNTEQHSRLKLKAELDCTFASTTNAVPLSLLEFPAVSAHYPIVFAGDEAAVPSAVVGIRNNENLFVDQKGQWLQGSYVPAYIRRYPFILARGQQEDFSDAVLCIDPTATRLSASEGQSLVMEDSKPSELTRQAIEFCVLFAREAVETEAFCKALREADLLVKRQIVINGPLAKQLSNGQETYTLGDFSVIDDQKLRQLPDDKVLEWFKRGWLQAAYAQIASVARWDGVIARIDKQSKVA